MATTAKPKIVYMVRHKVTGLYRLGHIGGMWSAKGKVWSSIGALKTHFSQFKRYDPKDRCSKFPKLFLEESKNWEVIPIEVFQSTCEPLPISSFIKE